MSYTKNQHYVPQFILKNFCYTDDYTFCFAKKENKIFTPNVRNIASESFYNDLENGVQDYSYEPLLTEIEDKAALGIKKLITERTIRSLNNTDFEDISLFIAIQVLRTKNIREEMWHMNNEIAKILRESGAEPDKVKNFYEFKSEKEVKEASLYNLRIASDLYPILRKKKWILYTSDEQFITSDNPVTRQNTINEDSLRGTLGLGSKGIEIYFPLSPSLTLCLFCEESFLDIQLKHEMFREKLESQGNYETNNFINSVRRKIPIKCSMDNVVNINSLQVIFSERFLFSRSNDFNLAQEMILENDKLKHGIRSTIR